MLPRNSIMNFDDNISIVCPELLLLQMASLLPFLQFCLIAYEFCGTFTIDHNTKNFVNNIEPITNKIKIENFIAKIEKKNKNAKSIKIIKNLLEVLEDGAASPMESRLFLKLCGNRKLGLYGCKNLKFNQNIEMSTQAQKIAGQRIIIPDIVNKQRKVAIEYNSSMFHEDSVQGQKDQKRRDALVYDG